MNKILLILLALPGLAQACFSPPDRHFIAIDRLYYQIDKIVLAEAIEEKPSFKAQGMAKFTFQTKEVLKGESGKAKFSLDGFLYEVGPVDFSKHEDVEFWANSYIGNFVAPGDCNVYGKFTVGETYLLIMGIDHPKAFEVVRSTEDRWYKTVKFMTQRHK
ncbi:hypothetical protein [Microbulbifer hydrolyticus]|uniref:Uncharacterized protein n=1 Tax=Microbulbifer hydrolyticus TaxID=48074 RepID=A0A6P1T9J2_9GAMM|nr:hypothetical protein [Microbulbifer hydrolyticus]MBB5213114.1 hypothetical protein [Microbulbifer hydrolyticus]QHQ38677.1 hypothetical protein GTQ55_06520 [Microbulbifer hydrolyticus]